MPRLVDLVSIFEVPSHNRVCLVPRRGGLESHVCFDCEIDVLNVLCGSAEGGVCCSCASWFDLVCLCVVYLRTRDEASVKDRLNKDKMQR